MAIGQIGGVTHLPPQAHPQKAGNANKGNQTAAATKTNAANNEAGGKNVKKAAAPAQPQGNKSASQHTINKYA
ncbi:MAG: hypothetical protein ABSB95_09240 [Dissulfurispiraceae bacterium]|jgi:hypothetical protein